MEKKLTIKVDVCTDALIKMRKIESEVQNMAIHEGDKLFRVSSGESVEELKLLVQEIEGLKMDVYNTMKDLSDSIENYVNDHVEFDEKTASAIKASVK